jgi:hypothetical protein
LSTSTVAAGTRWSASRAARATTRCAARNGTLLPLAEALQSELRQPLDLGCPLIVVDTDDGYEPPLETITRQIDAVDSRQQIHELDGPPPVD